MTTSEPTHTSTDPTPSPIRLWAFRLLATVLAPLLFLALAEGVLRVLDYGHPTRFWIPIQGRDAVATNPAFGWRFFPPTLARRPVSQDLAVPKPDGTYRIVVLGGSAAMGIPEPAYSFGRMLEVMLQSAYPDTRFEVVNAAMTAINSHVALTIAEDSAEVDPDLFIVFLGNNEVVGPWGAGSVLRQFSPNRTLIRAGITVAGTRGGQLLLDAISKLRSSADEPTGWDGMGLFLEHRLAADDPRLAPVYEHFAHNLEDMVSVAHRAGAEILLSTVPVNLLQNPPFASLHGSDFSQDTQERFDASLEQGKSLALAGRWSEALAPLQDAVSIDERYAEARYLLGMARIQAGATDEGAEHLAAARDLDALRFRADRRIQEVIRAVAEAQGAEWVDAEAHFAEQSVARSPGHAFFWEHVHLNPEGNYALAALLFEWIAARLSDSNVQGLTAAVPNFTEVAASLALTRLDRIMQAQTIDELMSRAPFTDQAGHRESSAFRRQQLAQMRQTPRSALVEEAHAIYDQAIAARPDDLYLRSQRAALPDRSGTGERLRDLEALLERVPESPGWWTDLGTARMEAEQFEAALEAYERAAEIDPFTPDLPLNLGMLELRRERFEDALTHFRAALERDPGHVRARLNLAAALDRLERKDESLAVYRDAVRLAPDRPLTHMRLGLAMAERDDLVAAKASYEKALELDPDHVATHYNLGVTYQRQGELDLAIQEFSKTLRLDPQHVQARDNTAFIFGWRGAELARRGESRGAIDQFRRAVEIHPESAAARNNLGKALAFAGQTEDAVETLGIALTLARRGGLRDIEDDTTRVLQALGADF